MTRERANEIIKNGTTDYQEYAAACATTYADEMQQREPGKVFKMRDSVEPVRKQKETHVHIHLPPAEGSTRTADAPKPKAKAKDVRTMGRARDAAQHRTMHGIAEAQREFWGRPENQGKF